jgi:hypothetical protein
MTWLGSFPESIDVGRGDPNQYEDKIPDDWMELFARTPDYRDVAEKYHTNADRDDDDDSSSGGGADATAISRNFSASIS